MRLRRLLDTASPWGYQGSLEGTWAFQLPAIVIAALVRSACRELKPNCTKVGRTRRHSRPYMRASSVRAHSKFQQRQTLRLVTSAAKLAARDSWAFQRAPSVRLVRMARNHIIYCTCGRPWVSFPLLQHCRTPTKRAAPTLRQCPLATPARVVRAPSWASASVVRTTQTLYDARPCPPTRLSVGRALPDPPDAWASAPKTRRTTLVGVRERRKGSADHPCDTRGRP